MKKAGLVCLAIAGLLAVIGISRLATSGNPRAGDIDNGVGFLVGMFLPSVVLGLVGWHLLDKAAAAARNPKKRGGQSVQSKHRK